MRSKTKWTYGGLTFIGNMACETLKAIKRLYVPGCKRLSDKGLESIAKMSSLTYLDILNNPQLTESAVRKLQAALPNCKILSDFPDK